MSRSARAGYALPVVLAVVGMLALVFASAASALAGLAAGVRGSADAAAFQATAMSAEAEAVFLTATRRFGPAGLGADAPGPPNDARPVATAVRLDGRPYAWLRDPTLRVRLQDEAGLLNLDRTRPDTLLRLFARLGLTAEQAETLRDRLSDALDGAKQRRPRGAVAADYAAAGLPAPRPGGFDGLSEAAGVLGWSALMTGERRRALEAWATANPGEAAFNVNTAPSQLGLPPAPAAAAEPVKPNGRVRLVVEDARRGLRYTSRLSSLDVLGAPPWIATGGALARTDPARAPPDAPFLPDPAGPAAAR